MATYVPPPPHASHQPEPSYEYEYEYEYEPRPEPQPESEPDSLAGLRGDCARMVPHWVDPYAAFWNTPTEPVPPSRIRGITVPAASAHLLDGMSDYGD